MLAGGEAGVAAAAVPAGAPRQQSRPFEGSDLRKHGARQRDGFWFVDQGGRETDRDGDRDGDRDRDRDRQRQRVRAIERHREREREGLRVLQMVPRASTLMEGTGSQCMLVTARSVLQSFAESLLLVLLQFVLSQ